MKLSDIEQAMTEDGKAASLGELLERVTSLGRTAWVDLPDSPGIYAVCLEGWEVLRFTDDPGLACHASPVSGCTLRDKRNLILNAGPTDILYIGRANDLRKRVRQLVRFGAGQADNHRGGEWLWQLDGIYRAQLWMWRCDDDAPEQLERRLLDAFKADHGDWPFANRC